LFVSTGELNEMKDSKNRITIISENFSGRIAMSGWLGKQGEFSLNPNNVKRRWFILRDNEGTDKIEYYTQVGGSLKGTINLMNCKIQNIEGAVNSIAIVCEKEGKEREYILFADSDQELKEWISAISAAINALQREREKSHLS